MADITAQNLTNDGITELTWAACAGAGDAFVNDSPTKYIALFRDTGGVGGQVVTAGIVNSAFDIPPYGDVTANSTKQVKTLAADGVAVFHNLSDLVFNDGNGKVNFTYSSETSLQIAIIKIV